MFHYWRRKQSCYQCGRRKAKIFKFYNNEERVYSIGQCWLWTRKKFLSIYIRFKSESICLCFLSASFYFYQCEKIQFYSYPFINPINFICFKFFMLQKFPLIMKHKNKILFFYLKLNQETNFNKISLYFDKPYQANLCY